MDRDRFLRLLKKFDDNYTVFSDDEEIFRIVKAEVQKENMTIKEYFSKKEKPTLCYFSQIDYTRIENLTQYNVEDYIFSKTPIAECPNPFTSFYHLEEEKLVTLFRTLHITNLFLAYFEDIQFDRLRTYKERQSLIKKYDSVIEDLEITTTLEDNAMNILKNRRESLKDAPTITEKRIFENLLFGVFVVLADRDKKTFSLTDRIANITNLIIEHYYSKRYNFSKNTNIGNFIDYHYTIETAKPMILFHSPAQ